MGAWTQLTVAVVTNALPTDMGTLYGSWVDANPAKANRLAELVSEVRETLRQGVAANPANMVDEDPETVPTTGFMHALHLVIFKLGMEMGVQFAPEVYSLWTQANIWLRMVQQGRIPVDTAAEGTPSYERPCRGRWVAGQRFA